ncbi:MAG: hypothetical protein ACK47D_10000 [Pseudanabaena sp.]|jgi:hypothetical protein
MSTELDNFPVSDLQDRYSIGRTQVYTRLEALNIKAEKFGNKSFINASQLVKLDSLDRHIKAGGAIADFQKVTSEHETKSTEQTGQISLISENEALQMVLRGLISETLKPVSGINQVFQNLELLDKAVDRKWFLSSSEIKELLAISSLPKSPFERYGFYFEKVGKNGNEVSWKISKVV